VAIVTGERDLLRVHVCRILLHVRCVRVLPSPQPHDLPHEEVLRTNVASDSKFSLPRKGELMKTLKLAFAVAVLALACSGIGNAATILFNDFSSLAGLQLNGDTAAAIDGGGRNVLRVTPAAFNQAGSAFSTSAVTLGADVSFSTKFRFNFNSQGFGGADGLVFVVQTLANNVGGLGGGIGYLGIGNSVGVEFDNWFNAGIDNNDNHVGIDLNGSVNSVARNDSPGFTFDSVDRLQRHDARARSPFE
jgi:hypothetical protein